MFTGCTSIAELNRKRAELMSTGEISIIDINNAYNAKRRELSSVTTVKNVLTAIKPIDRQFPPVYTIAVIRGNNPNIIQLTEKGFII